MEIILRVRNRQVIDLSKNTYIHISTEIMLYSISYYYPLKSTHGLYYLKCNHVDQTISNDFLSFYGISVNGIYPTWLSNSYWRQTQNMEEFNTNKNQ